MMSAGCAIMITLFFTYGYENTWHLWDVPAMTPYLMDARVITAGAEAHALGYDPLIDNPGFARMNYPRIWQLLFHLGINQSDTVYFGLVFAALFFCGVFLISENIDPPTAFLMTLGVFSPAVLLGLERGNNDLSIFFLLALAVALIGRFRVSAALVVGFAFLLKLYPVFALAMFLRESKKAFLVLMASSIAACGIYAAVMFHELMQIRSATPRPSAGAYGIDVLWTDLTTHHFLHAAPAIRIASYAVVVVVGVFSFLYARRGGATSAFDGHIDSFRVGAATYIGTFLIGGNWDYRLMFLLFVIPQLVCWTQLARKSIKHVAVATLSCVMISLWSKLAAGPHGHSPHISFLFGQFSEWLVFFGLIFLFICSLPSWLKWQLPSSEGDAHDPQLIWMSSPADPQAKP